MKIDSFKNVPLIYTTSRDYQALLKLFDILANVEKNDIDNLISCINADMCPSKYLPLLASYVGYDYNYDLPYDSNRTIIKYYPELIRNRGSNKGIMLACAVALNVSGLLNSATDVASYVNLMYTKEDGESLLTIFISNRAISPILIDLLQVVRPAGLLLRIAPALTVRSYDKVNIDDEITSLHGTVTAYNRNVVMPNTVADYSADDVNTVGGGESNETESEE